MIMVARQAVGIKRIGKTWFFEIGKTLKPGLRNELNKNMGLMIQHSAEAGLQFRYAPLQLFSRSVIAMKV